MSEETRESYDSGEVVWVKLGSCWWPGEVKTAEELPSEVQDFKKPPLVIVKFFDEDSYEYVKAWASIYPYECEKKNEFIKKGMAAYRSKVPHMEKFPKDVLKAEEKVGGNPNILSDPMFLPEKKRNYAAEVFGTPSPKTSTHKNKKRSSTNKSGNKKDTSHITHRRFLGVDDYRAYICIQYPGKDRTPGDKEDEEVIRINMEPEQDFNCHSCSFSTKRLEVMILHTKSHIQGVYQSSVRRGKQTAPRRRKEKSNRARGSDVVDSDSSTSDSEPVRQKKRKPKSQGTKKTKIKKVEEEEEKKKKDIRSELLEAWDDSDDEDLDFSLDISVAIADKSSKALEDSLSEAVPELVVGATPNKSDVTDTLDRTDAPDQNKTSQTETADEILAEAARTDERKSPSQTIEDVLNDVEGELDDSITQNELRPPAEQLSTEKLLSTLQDDSMDADEEVKAIQDNKEKEEAEQSKMKSHDDTSDEEATAHKSDADDDTSKQKMNRDMHEAIKSCFDFDEDDEEDNTIVSKAASGRKIPRVIPKPPRKDSDTDNTKTEPRKEIRTTKDKEDKEDMDAAFKDLMEMTAVPDLPDVQNTLKCEQNFHNIKTIKFPDKPEQVGSPPKRDRKDSMEVATKLTNPKKRFVKSFEDFELMQNEIRRREEETSKNDKEDLEEETSKNDKEDLEEETSKNDKEDLEEETSKNDKEDLEETKPDIFGSTSNYSDLDILEDQYSPDSNIELSKLKSKIMSKIIEEAKINPECKSRIMSKIHDPKHKTAESEIKPKTVDPAPVTINSQDKMSSHRTPRSKILESYRKDTRDQKQDTAPPDTHKDDDKSVKTEETQQIRPKASDMVPPKKSIWSRRGSHPKKDKNLITASTRDMLHEQQESAKKDDVVAADHPKEDATLMNEVLEEEKSETETVKSVDPRPTTELVTPQVDDSSSSKLNQKPVEELPPNNEEVKEKEKSPEPPKAADTPHKESTEDTKLNVSEEVSQIEEVCDGSIVAEEENQVGRAEEEDQVGRAEENDQVGRAKEDQVGRAEEEDQVGRAEEKDQVGRAEEKDQVGRAEEEDQVARAEAEDQVTRKEEGGIIIKDEEELIKNEEDKMEGKEVSEKEEGSQEPKEEAKSLPLQSASSPKSDIAKDEGSTEPVEESSIVPLNISAGDKSPAKEVKIPPDQIPEERVSSESVPEEDMPTKSRKRKMSDSDLALNSTKTDAESGPLSPKKRLNEMDLSTSTFQRFLVNDDKETTENEKVKESLEEKEITEEHLEDEKPSIEETVEIGQNKESEGIEKIIKDSDLENKETTEGEEENAESAQKDATTKEKEVSSEVEKPSDPECNKASDSSVVQDHNNEVEIHCASSSIDSFKFSIQTNLSILSSREEMSALALATLSEMKADLESNEAVITKDVEMKPEPPVLAQPEMVPIEGNLTVVSEKDLADGQVEITSQQVISPKRPVTLSNFSMDFSDSLSDSNSNSTTDTSCDLGKADFNSKGTEFTAKALTKQMKKLDHKKENTYGRLELINILEGNSDTERKPKEHAHLPKRASVMDDICDFEEHIPSQIVCAKNLKKGDVEQDIKEFKEKEKTSKTSVKSTASKLLERLTTESKAKASAAKTALVGDSPAAEGAAKTTKEQTTTPKTARYAVKSKGGASSKPIILSEQIVKPAAEAKLKQKKAMEDIEDVEAFVIHKDPNKMKIEEDETKSKSTSTCTKTAGKAKILQQTIITPAGEIIQPTVSEAPTDDNIFDINSMPIVLSDEIFTPESIEKMPIVIGSDTKATVTEKLVKRPIPTRIMTTVVTTEVPPNKTITIAKHKPPRILQTKVVKNSPLLPNTAKAGKYIIVPQSSIPATKYVAKKPTLIKKTPVTATGLVQKMPNIAPEPSGNKIMIVTNQQGQQQRLLLTPAQQKMLGYQNQKVTKTIVKGNVMQKSILAAKAEASTSGIVSKTPSLIGQKVLVGGNVSQGLITTTGQGRITKAVTKRPPAGAQKLTATANKPQKTILIKNQHGQTVKKIQGTDDELLDKQVAEQLKAIKASSGMKFSLQQKLGEGEKAPPKATARRSYSKRFDVKPRGPPPLALHQSSKQETVVTSAVSMTKKADSLEAKHEETKTQQLDRPLNQLVIQDAVGNQTTITEGQILALPSETVDGQPQSYMLVTLDESGNLTPLNSEALMSLDPNLGLGGDLSNMVLQIDQSALTDRPQTAIIKPSEVTEPTKAVEPQPVPEPEIPEAVPEPKAAPAAATPSTNGDPGQQLIVTGDPIATQKFLESLTEGTTDLANILANAEGNSILIQADGQQILINTNTDNQMLLSVNNDNANVTESTEGGGNPVFATQPSKNQDILAAALADTDVFQAEHPNSAAGKIVSQLSPSNALYPMNVGNVLETSLTLSSPIMTPLEVPSTNNKKIPDEEADILTQVPKNVDLPITITDPNISQTVANQQVSQMLANELQTNLELALPISETTISAVSTEMNSPSYVYSLPALVDSVEMTQKPFNGSMPLLNEDVEETMNKTKQAEAQRPTDDGAKEKADISPESFLSEEEGRFTLGGEMCSSLSEPPPEMFDLPETRRGYSGKRPSLQSTPEASDNASKDDDTTDPSQADTSSEGSCEIPVQPQIVTKSLELSKNLDSLKRSLNEAEGDNKKCKFD